MSDLAHAQSTHNRFELWIDFLRSASVEFVAEVGVWRGEFAATMLEEVQSIRTYFMVDPWTNLSDWNKPFNVDDGKFDEVYGEAMDRTSFAADKRVVLRGRTSDVMERIEDHSLDFAYIDGDHTLRGITIDLIKVLPKIAPGGWIGGDDFVFGARQHEASFEPTLVFPYAAYFAEAMGLPFMVLPHHQFLIRNSPELGYSFSDVTGRCTSLVVGQALMGPSIGRRLLRRLRALSRAR